MNQQIHKNTNRKVTSARVALGRTVRSKRPDSAQQLTSEESNQALNVDGSDGDVTFHCSLPLDVIGNILAQAGTTLQQARVTSKELDQAVTPQIERINCFDGNLPGLTTSVAKDVSAVRDGKACVQRTLIREKIDPLTQLPRLKSLTVRPGPTYHRLPRAKERESSKDLRDRLQPSPDQDDERSAAASAERSVINVRVAKLLTKLPNSRIIALNIGNFKTTPEDLQQIVLALSSSAAQLQHLCLPDSFALSFEQLSCISAAAPQLQHLTAMVQLPPVPSLELQEQVVVEFHNEYMAILEQHPSLTLPPSSTSLDLRFKQATDSVKPMRWWQKMLQLEVLGRCLDPVSPSLQDLKLSGINILCLRLLANNIRLDKLRTLQVQLCCSHQHHAILQQSGVYPQLTSMDLGSTVISDANWNSIILAAPAVHHVRAAAVVISSSDQLALPLPWKTLTLVPNTSQPSSSGQLYGLFQVSSIVASAAGPGWLARLMPELQQLQAATDDAHGLATGLQGHPELQQLQLQRFVEPPYGPAAPAAPAAVSSSWDQPLLQTMPQLHTAEFHGSFLKKMAGQLLVDMAGCVSLRHAVIDFTINVNTRVARREAEFWSNKSMPAAGTQALAALARGACAATLRTLHLVVAASDGCSAADIRPLLDARKMVALRELTLQVNSLKAITASNHNKKQMTEMLQRLLGRTAKVVAAHAGAGKAGELVITLARDKQGEELRLRLV